MAWFFRTYTEIRGTTVWVGDVFDGVNNANVTGYGMQDDGIFQLSLPSDPPSRVPPHRDPLIIDVDRDGKVSTSPGMVYFDMDGNGLIEQVKWAAPGDGLLVMDRDSDGKITTGRELFGDYTVMSDGRTAKTGFEALADLDSNRDGIIDANDAMYHKLRVWMDADGDGKFGENELFTLEEIGILSREHGRLW